MVHSYYNAMTATAKASHNTNALTIQALQGLNHLPDHCSVTHWQQIPNIEAVAQEVDRSSLEQAFEKL
jgi:hypothetical protein